MAGASHEKSFGHVDLEMLVRNPSDTVQADRYVGINLLKRSGPEAYIWEFSGYR